MRVLIINTNREQRPFPLMPIGPALVASAARRAGHTVSFLDLTFHPHPMRAIDRRVRSFRPEVTGFTARNIDNCSWLTSEFFLTGVAEMIRRVKRAGGGFTVVGGAALGVLPGEVVDYLGSDAGIWGDGEVAFVELLERLARKQPWRDVGGVISRNPDGTMRVNDQNRMAQLVDRPRPDLNEWIDVDRYLSHSTPIPIQTRRGCTYRCTYCTYRRIEGKSYRTRPVDEVVDELRSIKDRNPDAPVEFVDSTFNVPLDYTVKLMKAIAKADLGIPLHCASFNPGAVTQELFESMEEAGFAHVVVTPEAASPRTLKHLKKGFSRWHVEETARLRKQVSFAWFWVFLMGGPGENEQSAAETFEFIENHIPRNDLVFIQAGVRVYPHTALYDRAIEEGRLQEGDDLLRPIYYLSPEIQPERLRALILEHIARHPSSSTTKDLENPFMPLFHKLAGRLGIRRPSSPIAARTLWWLDRVGLR